MSNEDRKVGVTVVAKNEAKATFQEIKSDAAAMAGAVEQSGQQAAKGVEAIGDSAENTSQKVSRAQGRITSELIRVTEQTRIAAEAGGSLARALEIKGSLRGVDMSSLSPMVDELRLLEAQLSVAKAKEADFAAQNAFASKAAQAQELNKAGEYARWWASELEKAERAEKELAAQNAFSTKAAQAQELNKAREYARWWAVELDKVERAEQKLATQNGFIASLREQSEAIGKTRADLLELKAAQLGLTAQAAPHIAKLRESENAIGGVGMSARATAAAMAQVPLQFQDIVVSLQGGQAPLTVLLQQGSQLVGTFGGVGAATKALGTYMLSLVTPLTAVAAAVAVLGFAYYQGSKEIDNYRKALILSGNQAGTTADQLNQMAKAMSGVVGTQSAAAAGLAEMAQHSKVGSDKLQEFTSSALLWQRVTGQAVSETARAFADLSKDPVKAVLALNDQMNFLTATVYDQIMALDEQGRAEEAAAVAQKAYSDAMATRSSEMLSNMGSLERGWNILANAAKKAWDAMLNVGRPTSLEELRSRIDATNRDLNNMLTGDGFSSNEGGAAFGTGGRGRLARIDQLKKQLGDLQAQAAPLEAAEATSNIASVQKQYVDAMQDYDQISGQYASKETKRTQALTVERNKYNKAVKETNAAFAGTPELAGKLADLESKHQQSIEGINKKFTEKGKSGSGKPARDALSIDINATKRDLEVLTFSYTSAQKIMEAQRAAGLIDDKAYYEEKRKYINLEADAQDKLLQSEMDRYKQEKVTKDNRLQVEKGIADTQAKMDKAKMERSTALQVLGYQEEAALNAQKVSINAAEQAAKDYLTTLQKGFDRTVDAVGWGSERRNVEAGRQQIEDRYTQQRQDLANQRAQIEMQTGLELNAQQQELYDSRLAIINKYEALALQSYTGGISRRLEAEGQWLIGVDRAWQDYQSVAANVAQMSADAFTNAFRGMEDSLVTFVTTGKLSFTDMANSVVADITRIIIKQQISNALGVAGSGGGGGGLMSLIGTGIGMLGGGGAVASAASALPGDSLDNFLSLSGYRASGGDVTGGGLYEVNEQGPELLTVGNRNFLMMGQQGGYVTPNSQISQGGSAAKTTHINVTVQMPQGGSRETALQFGRTAGRQIAIAQSRNG